MYKGILHDIERYKLDRLLFHIHKEGSATSNFGMDNTDELIDGGFGIYSTIDMKKRIGPIKTEYFRIGLMREGSTNIDIGLETFSTARNGILFGFPGQIFSLYDQTEDFFCYYMLFNEEFVAGSELFKDYRRRFPFLSYSGIQYFQLSEEEGIEIENFVFHIDLEVKRRQGDMSQSIKLYIQLILVVAARSYDRTMLINHESSESSVSLFSRFIKLVSQHYLTIHKVSDYAALLYVSPDHLNRTIKSQSAKTAHELIDEMLLNEAKAHLLHSAMSVAEIAYKLEFSDPSHFSKFFRKYTGSTPTQYRAKSE